MFFSDIDLNPAAIIFNSKNFVNDSYIDTVENYIKNQQLEKAEFSHNNRE